MKKLTTGAAILLSGSLLLSACSTTAETQEEPKSLTVYRVETDALYMSALDTYKKEHSEIEIEITTFPSYEEMKDRLNTELMSGKGPDVLLYNSLYSEADPYKLAKSGSFLALDSYMETLPQEEYLTEILKAGVIDGKQYILPLSWNIFQTYFTQTHVEENGYQGQNIFEIAPKETKKLENQEDAGGFTISFKRADSLNAVVETAGLAVIDSSGEIFTDGDTFRQAAEFTRQYYDILPKIEPILQRYTNDFAGTFSRIGFYVDNLPFMYGLRYYQSLFVRAMGEEMAMTPVNHPDGKGITAQVVLYGAVNANTKSPNAAWNLLKSIADAPASMGMNKMTRENYYYAPVNAANYEACASELYTQAGPGPMGRSLPLNDDNFALLLQIPKDVTLAVIPNPSVGSIVQDCMEPYLTGAADYESCYQDLMNKLALYLDE